MTDTVTSFDQSIQSSAGVQGAGTAIGDPKDFVALLKPRVMSLVIFTALVGLVAAPGTINPVLATVSIFLIAIGAGASGALNMWFDADIDAVMKRTAARPIPAGKVTPGQALGFGMTLSVFSVVLLGLIANVTAAALLALTIFFYAVVYSMWLKRRTAQNIVIGGAAGAFPPVIGWAVVTDSVTVESLILFAIIFFWTPAHFWALSLFIAEDYKKVGVPMLPVVAGKAETRKQILLYSLILMPFGLSPYFMGFAGPVYGAVAVVLNLLFLRQAIGVFVQKANADRGLFKFSILYLFLTFATLMAEPVIAGVFQ